MFRASPEELTIVNALGFGNMNKLGVDKSSKAGLWSWPEACLCNLAIQCGDTGGLAGCAHLPS